MTVIADRGAVTLRAGNLSANSVRAGGAAALGVVVLCSLLVVFLVFPGDPGGPRDAGAEQEPARVGDWVLVHVGFAMAKIDEAEARETLDQLKALGEMYEQELSDYSAQIEGLVPEQAGAGGPS